MKRPRAIQHTEKAADWRAGPFCAVACSRGVCVCVCAPATPPSTQELREDCTAFRILTLSSFFFHLLPLSSFPFHPLFLPQGLSHLMMSEQGRCFLLVVTTAARLACLRASGWLLRASSLLAGHLLTAPHVVGQAGSRATLQWGAPFPMHRGFPPPHPLGFSILHHHLSSGCWPCRAASKREGSMKRGMTG